MSVGPWPSGRRVWLMCWLRWAGLCVLGMGVAAASGYPFDPMVMILFTWATEVSVIRARNQLAAASGPLRVQPRLNGLLPL